MEKVINAKIEMMDGKVMNLELYPEIAPISVENFVTLAKSGFYEGLIFHRVIKGFMIQGGAFTDMNKAEKATAKTIKGEFKSNGVNNPLKHTLGVLSMARTNVPDSASSQFFICVADASYLDGQYAAFGKLKDKESMEQAIAISKERTKNVGGYDDVPVTRQEIKSVTIL